MSNNKQKSWVFTLNNPTDEEIQFFENIDCNRIVVGDEVGDSGTRHLQGFITFSRAHRLAALKKLSPRAHWECAKTADAANYCMKEKILINRDNRKQGHRSDINSLKALIDSGSDLMEIREQHYGLYLRYKRVILEDMALKKAKVEIVYTEFNTPFIDLDEHPVVSIVGPSGIGKTQYAKAHFKNPLLVRHIDDLKNFTDHDGIVFDDMDFTHWPPTSQIHLTDVEENSSINVKYGTALIPRGTKRIFTCNTYPFSYHPAVERRVYKREIENSLF